MSRMCGSDEVFLRQAIELSAQSLVEDQLTPFGAVVVRDGEVLGQSASRVIAACDPTAHAEVEAIRQATQTQGSHLLPGTTLYCSGFPCPLCLSAAMWSQVGRIVYAASLADSARAGFEDEQMYRMFGGLLMGLPCQIIGAPEPFRVQASQVLLQWKASLTAE